jgi:hypothetical protein
MQYSNEGSEMVQNVGMSVRRDDVQPERRGVQARHETLLKELAVLDETVDRAYEALDHVLNPSYPQAEPMDADNGLKAAKAERRSELTEHQEMATTRVRQINSRLRGLLERVDL